MRFNIGRKLKTEEPKCEYLVLISNQVKDQVVGLQPAETRTAISQVSHNPSSLVRRRDRQRVSYYCKFLHLGHLKRK